MLVTLEVHPFGCYLVRGENGTSRLFQHSDDLPLLAQAFGWSPSQIGDFGEMVSDAREFLDYHIGTQIEDPGYV